MPNVSVLGRSSASRVRDEELYHTILDISFDTCYIAQVSSVFTIIDSFDISKYRDTRVVTIRYPHDTIRIAILESRYDTYRDTW